MLRGLKRRVRDQRGQALVEFALVLPILLILLFGIFDFGRAIQVWNSETSLANVAARYAAVGTLPTYGPCTSSESTLTTYVQCIASSEYQLSDASSGLPGIQPPSTTGGSPVNVCVNVAPSGNAYGQPVTVVVYAKYDWLPVARVLGSSFNPATIVGSATMRIENGSGVPTAWVNSTSTTGCDTSNP